MSVKNNILISIVIPAFNAEYTIERAVKSVQNQTYNNIEIIIVSDGSKDQTVNICKYIAEKDNRISIIEQENLGPYEARYTGINCSKGKYVMFLDSDDYIKINAVEKLLKIACENDSDLIKFKYEKVNDSKVEYIQEDYFNTDKVLTFDRREFKEKIYPFFLNGYMLNSMCTTFIKRSCIAEHYGFKKIRFGEDLLLNLENIKNIEKISFTNEIFYEYYINNNSTTKTNNIKVLLQNLKDAIYVYTFLYKCASTWGIDERSINKLKTRVVYEISTRIVKIDLSNNIKDIIKDSLIINDTYINIINNINIKEMDPNMKNYDLIISLINGSFFEHKN